MADAGEHCKQKQAQDLGMMMIFGVYSGR